MFKKRDYVKIKPDTVLDNGALATDWAGQIEHIYRKDSCCAVVLDAPTINNLSDETLKHSLEEGLEPFIYIFEFKNLEKAPRRDTDDQMMEALENLSERAIALEAELETAYFERANQWINTFQESPFYNTLTTAEQAHVKQVLDTFMEFAYTYTCVTPKQWDVDSIEEICLQIVPETVLAEDTFFEAYGTVLIAFLKFLGEQQYITGSEALILGVEKIKARIPLQANDPTNWDWEKVTAMRAQLGETAIQNRDDANTQHLLQQLKALEAAEAKVPVSPSNFKDIGRNQKITVQYTDGRIVEDIKFKKVSNDLQSGACVLLKS